MFEATFATILAMLTWIYGVPGLQPKNARKTRKFVLFLQNSLFSSLKSVPLGDVTLQKRVTDLHQRFPLKKAAISKFSRTMIHLGWSQGLHLRHAISPCPDQLETCGLDH